jgi:light-regulated signal transduction histidine kinase (bacteriophytochrome)
LELPLTSPVGERHIFQGSYIPRFNPQGEVDGLIGYFHDTTEQKKVDEEIRNLNDALQHRAAELEAANRELEAFSYSASHDLRAPLRSIDGYSHILLEDSASHLNDESKAHLVEIVRATERMSHLIDGMLTLSRITRAQLQTRNVNLSAMAAEIFNELRKQEPKRQVDVRIEPDLQAKGDPQLLQILLDNLMGNAWKFSGRQRVANIQFGKTGNDGETVFFVRDNGVGFDMKYAGKLFGAFQRLHKSGDFPGTGIGLATVLRVVSRHGGRIWAESQVDRGTTFYFTLSPPANGTR